MIDQLARVHINQSPHQERNGGPGKPAAEAVGLAVERVFTHHLTHYVRMVSRMWNTHILYRWRSERSSTGERGASKSRVPAESFLPLSPVSFYVLLALTDGAKHGYAIMRGVA